MKIQEVRATHTVKDDCGNPKSRSLTAKFEEGDNINEVIRELEDAIWKDLADSEHQYSWRKTTSELQQALIEQCAIYKKAKCEYDRFLVWAKETGTINQVELTNFSELFPTLEDKLSELDSSHSFNRQLQGNNDFDDISF